MDVRVTYAGQVLAVLAERGAMLRTEAFALYHLLGASQGSQNFNRYIRRGLIAVSPVPGDKRRQIWRWAGTDADKAKLPPTPTFAPDWRPDFVIAEDSWAA